MVFFDLITRTHQWSKVGVPDDVYMMTDLVKRCPAASDIGKVDTSAKDPWADTMEPRDYRGMASWLC